MSGNILCNFILAKLSDEIYSFILLFYYVWSKSGHDIFSEL